MKKLNPVMTTINPLRGKFDIFVKMKHPAKVFINERFKTILFKDLWLKVIKDVN